MPTPPLKPPCDAFIAYLPEDRDWVHGFLLARLGLPAERVRTELAFVPGEFQTESFEQAVLQSRYVILILRPAALETPHLALLEQMALNKSVNEQRPGLLVIVREEYTLPLRLEVLNNLDCTSDDPETWEGAVKRIRELLVVPEPPPAELRCPYPGMVPFTPTFLAPFADCKQRVFFGREDEVADLRERLQHQSFLMLIGASGSGKSSLVVAGLLPELLREGATATTTVVTLRPGPAPLDALKAALGGEPSEAQLTSRRGAADRLLVIIDSFEEVFTQAGPAAQAAFFAPLRLLRQSPACALLLVMRADFYAELMASPLWPLGAAERIELAPLRDERLAEAIQRPAEQLGVRLEPRLVERLCAHTDPSEPGALPMLQEALRRLWEQRAGGLLTLYSYERLGGSRDSGAGGLIRAVESAADQAIYCRLTPAQQRIARRVLLRLVQFGEGRADTRRQLGESQLRAREDAAADFATTVNVLTESRLLTLSGSDHCVPSDAGCLIERRVDLSHEALISDWKTLATWISERRRAEQKRRRLEEHAEEWIGRGRGGGGLLDEVELREARQWMQSASATALWVDECIAELVQRSAAVQRHRQRVSRLGTLAITVLVVVAATAALVALGQWYTQRQFADSAARVAPTATPAPVAAEPPAGSVALPKPLGHRPAGSLRALLSDNLTRKLRGRSEKPRARPPAVAASVWWPRHALGLLQLHIRREVTWAVAVRRTLMCFWLAAYAQLDP